LTFGQQIFWRLSHVVWIWNLIAVNSSITQLNALSGNIPIYHLLYNRRAGGENKQITLGG